MDSFHIPQKFYFNLKKEKIISFLSTRKYNCIIMKII